MLSHRTAPPRPLSALSFGRIVFVPAVLLIFVLRLIRLFLIILLILLLILFLVLISILVVGHCNHLFSQLSMNASDVFYTVLIWKIDCCKPSAGLI